MSKPNKSNSDLAASVNSLIDQARNAGGGNAKYRQKALEYYEGEVDFPSMGADHSSYVSRDVSDTIGLVLPGLMRVFFGSNRVVDFNPAREEHEAYHDHAADYVNYVLLNKCDGYELFLYAFFDALLLGNGVIKYWWDDTPEKVQKSYEGLPFEQVKLLESDPENEIVEQLEYVHPEYQEPTADQVRANVMAMPQVVAMAANAGIDIAAMSDEQLMEEAAPYLPEPPKLYNLKVERTLSEGRLKAISMPPESFLLLDNETALKEDTRFACHWRQPTRSELVEEGFKKNKVYALPRAVSRDEESDREGEVDDRGLDDDAPDKSTEKVDIYECYILLDRDGDGIAERWRVDIGGAAGSRSVLNAEPWEDPLPFADLRTDPVAHRYRGRSIFDETSDIQDIKTVSIRGLLDNLYDQLKPQMDVEEGTVVNPDELYNPTFGGTIWRRKSSRPITPIQKEFLAPKIAPVLEMLDQIVEKRTGISQNSQALSMEALQNQSATAVNAAVSASFSKIEQYARNLKECGGLKRFFSNILKLLTKYQDWAEPIKLRGEWVPMKPSDWDPDMIASVNTGLGTGSRERDFAILQGILAKIEMLIAQMGPYNEHAHLGTWVELLHKMMEAGGISDPEQILPAIDDKVIEQKRDEQTRQPNSAQVQAEQKAAAEKYSIDQKTQLERYKIDKKAETDAIELRYKHEQRLEEIRQEAKLTAISNAVTPGPADTNISRVG